MSLTMAAKPNTVDEYLASLPDDRRAALNAVREVMKKNLDPAYSEQMAYGMIGYVVPHSLYPAGYHCDPKLPLGLAILGSQKNYLALHLMCLYSTGAPESPAAKLLEWFQQEWAKTGKKLDMGKACLRFKRTDDLALEVIGKLLKKVPASKWIAMNEAFLEARKKPAAKKK